MTRPRIVEPTIEDILSPGDDELTIAQRRIAELESDLKNTQIALQQREGEVKDLRRRMDGLDRLRKTDRSFREQLMEDVVVLRTQLVESHELLNARTAPEPFAQTGQMPSPPAVQMPPPPSR